MSMERWKAARRRQPATRGIGLPSQREAPALSSGRRQCASDTSPAASSACVERVDALTGLLGRLWICICQATAGRAIVVSGAPDTGAQATRQVRGALLGPPPLAVDIPRPLGGRPSWVSWRLRPFASPLEASSRTRSLGLRRTAALVLGPFVWALVQAGFDKSSPLKGDYNPFVRGEVCLPLRKLPGPTR
jgi:hypothetical protein